MVELRSSWRALMAVCCCLVVALAPALAEARGGNSYGSRPSSFGSRGLRSFENNGAQPLGRGASPQFRPGYGAAMPAPAMGGSFFQRHPFLTGLAGGLFGSWLFGHAASAAGGGGSGFFGTLIWLAIIAGLIWFGLRLFRARAPTAWPTGAGRSVRSAGAAASPVPRPRGSDINVSDADLNAFQRLHAAIQYAWSAGDLGRLRQLMTPEMLSHFSEELARNTGRGVKNIVSNVELLNGDLMEAWDEGDRQYASARLRWRANDYVQRLGAPPGEADAIIGGDPSRPVEAEEMWTFVRRPGSGWLLSAIQQI